MSEPEAVNATEYSILYRLEIALREAIIRELSELDGRWWKKRVPGGLQQDAAGRLEQERKKLWRTHVDYPLIYYLDFPKLREIVIRRDNWDECFKRLFRDKEQFEASLRRVEGARNRIAHCRPCTEADGRHLHEALQLLCEQLGSDVVDRFVSAPTAIPDGRQRVVAF